MRVAFALLAAGLALAAARGESARRSAVVEVDGVEVRSGCAHSYPAVGQFKKGDTVIVVREEDTGFLAIVPPADSVSWIKEIHLGKVDGPAGGKANVAVAVDGADVMAGSDRDHPPTNRVTAYLPKGTIVEVLGPAVRFGKASWFPITPPEGDLRWVPKSAIRASSLTSLTPPPYVRPDTPAFTVSTDGSKPAARPATASLPAALTDHRLWTQADAAERTGDYAAAKSLYARIYQDLWDQKAERDAIVICYNRYTRCDTALKGGEAPRARTRSESRSETPPAGAGGGKWSSPGYLQEMQKVFVDDKQVYSFQDDRGTVLYFATAVPGINLRNYEGKRVQVYGFVSTQPELYKPHMRVERVEIAK